MSIRRGHWQLSGYEAIAFYSMETCTIRGRANRKFWLYRDSVSLQSTRNELYYYYYFGHVIFEPSFLCTQICQAGECSLKDLLILIFICYILPNSCTISSLLSKVSMPDKCQYHHYTLHKVMHACPVRANI